LVMMLLSAGLFSFMMLLFAGLLESRSSIACLFVRG
jgi:hypothetical protein